MRKLFNVSALLCAVALATSCSNEEMIENGASADDFTLIATTGADTRTTVGIDDYKVRWTSGDAFYAFSKKKPDGTYSAKGRFDWTSGEDTEGKFKGQMTGKITDLQYAVYLNSTYDYGTMIVTFPTEYTFPKSNAPMFGKVEGKTVKFNQLLSGMMRIRLTGLKEGAAGSLTLKGAKIEGPAKLSIDANTGEASLAGISEDGTGSVKVSFVNPSETKPLVLDIPVPAATYDAGITAELALDGAANTPQVFKSTASFKVELGKIIEMPEISNIEIDADTKEITFSKAVENVDEAIEAMEAGAKNVTIKEMTAESITIPSSSKADAPVTINISSVSTNNFTVEGASDGIEKSVIINMPEGSTGTVTVKNIEHVEISGGWSQVPSNTVGAGNPLVIAAGEGVKELTVKEIEHVEVSGNWEKVNSSTGPNTLVLQANAVVEELIVNEGNIEIKENGVIKTLTLNNDVTINNLLEVPTGKTMTVNLGTHTLTLTGDVELANNNFAHICGELILKGAGVDAKGRVVDNARGLSLREDNAKLTIENVDYTCKGGAGNASGLHMYQHVNHTTAIVKNSTITSGYYCINTNGTAEVGTDNLFTLENSEFTAAETALMINNNATVNATNCKFTGGWQAAFLRGGTFEFKTCGFNLNVLSGDINETEAGAENWTDGNNAPSAAITAGNKYKNDTDYNHKTNLTLANGCTFTIKENGETSTNYPAIYLDAKASVSTQGVTFTYDENCRTAFAAAGEGLVINNITGEVIVNTVPYKGNGGE